MTKYEFLTAISIIAIITVFACTSNTTQSKEPTKKKNDIALDSTLIKKNEPQKIVDSTLVIKENKVEKPDSVLTSQFEKEYNTRKLYQLRKGFNSRHKETKLLQYYEHFIHCIIAESFIKDKSFPKMPKKDVVRLVKDNMHTGWSHIFEDEIDDFIITESDSLVDLPYEEYKKKVVYINCGPYMSYEFLHLDKNAYLMLLNMSGSSISNHYTYFTKKYKSKNKYKSYDFDKFLTEETKLVNRKMKNEYSPWFSLKGITLVPINGLNYYQIAFSGRGDGTCCPSVMVAVPSLLIKNRDKLNRYYVETKDIEKGKPVKNWKKLNE